MKILYLKLVNFAGIYAGMGRTELELDFTKDINGNPIDDNKITLIFGKNASGKSTILSTLHPYRDTGNDNRGNPIVENKDGYKEIHYMDDDIYYILKHYYYDNSPNKSYMLKLNGEEYNEYKSGNKEVGIELNENGGIRSCEDLIEDLLELNKEFFKISRIGSNVTNFIDLQPAERKEFISMFLPDIQEYLDAYDKTNSKYRLIQKEIKYVVDQIQKHDTAENLDIEIESYENQIESHNRLIESNISSISKLKSKIETLDPNGKFDIKNMENPHIEEKNLLERKVDKLYNNISENLKNINLKEIKKFIPDFEMDTIDKDLEIIEVKYNNIKENYNITKENLGKNNKKYNDLKNNSKDDNIDIESTQESIKKLEDEIKNTKNRLNKLELVDDPSLFKYDDIFDIRSSVNLLQETVLSSKDVFTLNELNLLESMDYSDNLFNHINRELKKISKNIDQLKDNIDNNTKKYLSMENNLDQLDILDKRPDECSIDDCPFIKNALKYENLDDDMDRLNKIISKDNEKMEKMETYKDILNRGYESLNSILEIFNRVENDISELKLYDDIYDYETACNLLFKSNKEIYTLLNIDSLRDYKRYEFKLKNDINNLDKYKNLEEKYNKEREENIKILNEMKTMSEEIKSLEIKMNEENKKMNDFKNLLKLLQDNKILIDNANSDKEKYLEYKKEYEEIEKLYNEYEKDSKDIINHLEYIEKYEGILKENRTNLKNTQKLLDEVKYKRKSLDEFEKRKKELEDRFHNIDRVRTSLHPNQGIPVYFIDNYLDVTRDISNELLDISQNGNFAINFDVDSRNFFIQVYKSNGEHLDDIRFASQGETSITSLSLSLALIEQSMTKHNILYLDELDGALDGNNRRGFIEMVETQMEKLDIEQVFIISHNNEFDYYPINLILLEDHSFDIDNKELMSNKNIIFKY